MEVVDGAHAGVLALWQDVRNFQQIVGPKLALWKVSWNLDDAS